MKLLTTILFSFLFIVCASSQTRNVIVNTNSVVVQPTNFWSADSSNARVGLGLGNIATSNSSAFQASSSVLSNLTSSNGVNLTNLNAANVVGIVGSASNVTAVVSLVNGGTSATNASQARTNLGIPLAALTNSNTSNFRTAIGLGQTNTVYFKSVYMEDTNISLNLDPSQGLSIATLSTNTNRYITSVKDSGFVSYEFGTGNSIAVGPATGLVFAGVAAGKTRTNLSLGWSALTNTNAATSLLGVAANGQVVANTGTNVLKFTNSIVVDYGNGDNVSVNYWGISGWSNAFVSLEERLISSGGFGNWTFDAPISFSGFNSESTTRTNLGLGWSALTNTNSGTGLVSVNSTGVVVSPTNFWTSSPLGRVGYIQYSAPITNSTNAAEAARNLFVFSLAPSISGVTNTVQLPVLTNGALYGDIAVVVHKGPTNSATIVRNGIDLIVLTNTEEAISLLYATNGWDFYPNLAFHDPIYFTTTNASLDAARSRTNLGLPLTALTNTNNANFQGAVFNTNTNVISGGSFAALVTWMEVNVVTNGVLTSFRVPLFK